MKLAQFIAEQLQAMKDYEILQADFQVCLDEKGDVVPQSMNTIRFTLNIK